MEDPHLPRPLDRIGDRYRPILIPAIGPKIGDRSIPSTGYVLPKVFWLVNKVNKVYTQFKENRGNEFMF